VSASGRALFESGRAVRIIGTVRDVTELHRLQARASEAHEQERIARVNAERAASLAELFVAVLGHDLRNPLASIVTGASLLIQYASEERQRRTASRLLRSSQRMSRMIEQILDLTRIRVGKGLPFEPQATDLREVLDRVRAEFPEDARSIEIHAEGDTRGEWDEDRLAQVFSNLLGNAVEHSPRGTVVRVHVDGHRFDRVLTSVHNAGAISADVLPHVFEPFRRAASASSRGLGLGLFITKEILAAHGGTITVTSSTSNGTRFELVLPRRRATFSEPHRADSEGFSA
jgi:signal transduction histidine kinase